MQDPDIEKTEEPAGSGIQYPRKPAIVEKRQNAVSRSLISLFIYALLFYIFFDQNLTYVAAILIVLIVHEMGHFLMMKKFSYNDSRIYIIPILGAFNSRGGKRVSQGQLSLIILAGPVPGIVVGTLLYYFNLDWQNGNVKILAYSFLVINLLNCLPFYPLDGGRLIGTLFYKDNYVIHFVFSIISILALIVFSLLSQSFIMLLIPFLIILGLYNESKYQKIREYLRQERINYRTDYDSLPDKDYWLIRDCLIFSFPKKYASLSPGRYDYSIFEGIVVQHIQSVLQTGFIADLQGLKKIAILVFYVFIVIAPVIFIVSTLKLT